MIHPIPPGTRDILPEEKLELRDLGEKLLGAFAQFGYREVATPTMEYEGVLERGDEWAAGASYRLFDEQGQVLVLRPDMTIPIARMAALRYVDAPPPLRFCYLALAYRSVQPRRGQQREFLQAGVELIGVPGLAGDAEVIAALCQALDAAGLGEFRIGVGDGTLYSSLARGLGVEAEPLLEKLAERDFVGLERVLGDLEIPAGQARALAEIPRLRGGPDVFEAALELGGEGRIDEAIARLRELNDLLGDYGVADRVIFDLGLLRELGYYTGAIFEVYDPAFGFTLGGGGRYDDLLGRFGKPGPAVGFALLVERLHIALAEEHEETLEGEAELREGVLVVGGLDRDVELARRLRERGLTVDAVLAGTPDPRGLARDRGLRHVVTATGSARATYEVVSGERDPSIEAAIEL